MRLSLANMPFKSLKAHPVRALILVLLAAAQAACVFGGALMADAARGDLSLAQERLGADVIVYPYAASYKANLHKVIMQGTPVAAYAPRAQLADVDDCDGIAAVTHQVYVPGPEGGPPWVVGFDTATDFVLGPWIAEGRDYALPAGSILIGAHVDAPAGEVELYGRTWPVAAHLEETGSELDDEVYLGMGDMRVVVADALAAGVDEVAGLDPLTDYSALLVRVAEDADVGSVASWLKVYVRKTKTVQSEEALTETSSGISWQSAAIGGMAAVAWAVLLAALAVAQSMAMRERAGELFVWRAAGASRKTVRRVMVREAVAANVAGALLGVLAAATVLVGAGLAGGASLAFAVGTGAFAVVLSALAGWGATSLAVNRVMKASGGQMLVAA